MLEAPSGLAYRSARNEHDSHDFIQVFSSTACTRRAPDCVTSPRARFAWQRWRQRFALATLFGLSAAASAGAAARDGARRQRRTARAASGRAFSLLLNSLLVLLSAILHVRVMLAGLPAFPA